MKKIILLGYMGSGKSIVGLNLSKILHKTFIDLDNFIEERENLSVNDIFKLKGELHFRKLEHEVFKELIESDEEFVLSLGGGTPCYANNHLLLKNDNVTSFYLKTSIEELFERLIKNKSKRPLIASMEADELKEFIAKHLFDRSFYYYKAQHTIQTDNATADEVVDRIIKLIV